MSNDFMTELNNIGNQIRDNNAKIEDWCRQCGEIQGKIDRLKIAKDKIKWVSMSVWGNKYSTDMKGGELEYDSNWVGIGKNYTRAVYAGVSDDLDRILKLCEFLMAAIDAKIQELREGHSLLEAAVGEISNLNDKLEEDKRKIRKNVSETLRK
ncbi:MAG: DUF5082 domain-containing protein [Lachnospiraceae bacterium]|nr:DUF5082 domain-containing protein [Lachnospiraceae bacterium]